MVVAWVVLVAALATHQPQPLARDTPPEWYVRICAEVSAC